MSDVPGRFSSCSCVHLSRGSSASCWVSTFRGKIRRRFAPPLNGSIVGQSGEVMGIFDTLRAFFRKRHRSVAWGADRRLVISDKYFDVPPDLLEELRIVRARRDRRDEIERAHDAFLLDPGLGPATYLSAEGRILWDDDGWGVEAKLGWAYAAIVTGARKLGLPSLLQ